MLIDFYTGDTGRIVQAWKQGDVTRAAPHVIASADLSFHLSEDDLERLLKQACSLLQSPYIGFAQAIRKDLDLMLPESEAGIHEMTDAFTELFAAIPPDRVADLYQLWWAPIHEEPVRRSETALRQILGKMKGKLEAAIFTALLAPILACAWLFSPGFRRDRARNRATRTSNRAKAPVPPENTLQHALEALIFTCRTAKSHGTKVVYVWSL